MSKKEIRSAKEWANFFIDDRDWVSGEYLGGLDENDVRYEIIGKLGGDDRIPTVKKLDDLKIKNRIREDIVEIIKPFDIIVDDTTSDLNRIPSVDENGGVTNLKWTNYKVVHVFCEVECPEDYITCVENVCEMYECDIYDECIEFECNEFDCTVYGGDDSSGDCSSY